MLHLTSKTRTNVVVLWAFIFFVLYYLFSTGSEIQSLYDNMYLQGNSQKLSNSLKIDAIVYIAMGNMAAERTIDLSIISLRKLGQYSGEIYVVTDSPECFTLMESSDPNLKIVTINPLSSILHIKALKTKLISFLPIDKKTVVYIDVDILISKPFYSFTSDVAKALRRYSKLNSKKQLYSSGEANFDNTSNLTVAVNNGEQQQQQWTADYDLGAFYDSLGHYVGFCSGCEKWHTGGVALL
jgi:hypothetical protein